MTYTYPTTSGSATVTLSYSTYTVQTNFGCSGISEFGPSSESLVSSITLPDGTSYAIQYEQTPGYPGSFTGRIASVTLPTGGTMKYTYTGGNNGINCSDGSTAGLTRHTPDGTWTYTRSGTSPATTTTILDPQNNQTVINFQGLYETERQIYQGSGTVLKTVYTCYNGASAPCNNTSPGGPPFSSVAVTTALDNGLESETLTNYNSYDLPTETDEYGYGNGAVGALGRKTVISYASLGSIRNRPAIVQVYNGSGGLTALTAQTTYGYDGNGNLLTLTENVTGSSTISRSFTYTSNGMVQTATDFNNNTTTFNYGSGSCNGAFPTSVSQPLSLSSSLAWNCNTGLMTSVTDPNNQTTSFSYDAFYRPTVTNYPDGGSASINYTSATDEDIYTALIGSASRHDQVQLDSLGRVAKNLLESDPAGPDEVDTTYDALGRVASVSNPYRSTSDPTYGLTRYAYDALNRVTAVTDPDSTSSNPSSTSVTYGSGSPNCSTGPSGMGYPELITDEAGHQRRLFIDAFGQVVESDEPDPYNNNAFDYWLCSSYDALGNLTNAAQGNQPRNYTYDGLSRLLSAKTAESGTTYYSYTTSGGGLCSGDPSEVCTRTDARGITTTYAYDALNRLTAKSYSDGTPTANFWYDGSYAAFGGWSVNGLTNTKGRLFATCTSNAVASCPGGYTGTVYSYDAMGRVVNYWQCTPYNCGSSAGEMTYNYDLAGDVTSWAHPAGFTITNTINAAQQVTQMSYSPSDGTHPSNFIPSITYTPWGAESTLENGCAGSGCTNTVETYTYNNRLQPVMIELGNTGNAAADYCLVYNYYTSVGNPGSCAVPSQGTGNNGNVMGVFFQDSVNSSLSHTEAYTYDALNRLTNAAATGNSTYNLTFAYDSFGNMTCQATLQTQGFCPIYKFDQNTNRITTAGFSYDAAGNLTQDASTNPVNTYQWDAEGRLSAILHSGATFETLAYNAGGQVVESAYPGYNDKVEGVFDPSGKELGYYNGVGGAWWDRDIWAAGRMVAQSYSADTYFLHAGHLGSDRQITDYSGAVQTDFVYYPWEIWKYAGTQVDAHFAGFQQSGGPNYPTPNRQYSGGLGRWLSPDPVGGNVADPQSLNRYAYALNNPTTLTDPSGLQPGDDSDCTWDPSTNTLNCPAPPSTSSDFGPGDPMLQFIFDIAACLNPLASCPFPSTQSQKGAAPAPKPTPPGPMRQTTCVAGNSGTSLSQYFSGVGSAASMFGQFLTGTGPSNLTFGPQSVDSQMMSSSPGIAQAINRYDTGNPSGTYVFGLSGLWNAGLNPVQQFVGSYAYRVVPTNGGLNITLSNYTSVHSGSYHLLPSHQRSTFGPLGTTHQTYEVFVPCHP